jgi:hypothetical protein
MGRELKWTLYNAHKKSPMLRSRYMRNEISSVDRVVHAFISWGRNESVVQVPAINPRSVVLSIAEYFTTSEGRIDRTAYLGRPFLPATAPLIDGADPEDRAGRNLAS